MKQFSLRDFLFFFVIIGLAVGWWLDRRPNDASATSKPLASGRILTVTYWEKPVAHEGTNSGNSPAQGSLVELYDGFIIIREPNGRRIVSPHGWYTNLMYESEP